MGKFKKELTQIVSDISSEIDKLPKCDNLPKSVFRKVIWVYHYKMILMMINTNDIILTKSNIELPIVELNKCRLKQVRHQDNCLAKNNTGKISKQKIKEMALLFSKL